MMKFGNSNLLEVIDLLLSFDVSGTYADHLANKIETHNKNYVSLFNEHLKPKFHNFVHYPTVVRQSGPFRKFWCFKFESKHKQL